MKSSKFVEIAKDIANNYKTLYVMGCFGAPMNTKNKERYCNNHTYNKQASRTKMIKNASSDTFGFDCVCLIKGILWGWNGNKRLTYGGATYLSNGVPDVSADQIITSSHCTDISTDFSNIAIGEIVWLEGHVGIYIGNNKVVECTPSWKNKVQITELSQRKWLKHGKLKYVEYEKQKSIEEVAQEVLDGKWGNGVARKEALTKAGYDYNKVQAKVNELVKGRTKYYPKCESKYTSIVDALKSIKVNSSFANRLKIANKNGISIYIGTSAQNKKLLDMLKKGTLKMV